MFDCTEPQKEARIGSFRVMPARDYELHAGYVIETFTFGQRGINNGDPFWLPAASQETFGPHRTYAKARNIADTMNQMIR